MLGTADQGLRTSGQFSSVTGALDPNGTAVTPAELAEARAQLAGSGPPGDLPMDPPVGYTGTTAAYDAYKASGQSCLRRRSHHPLPDRPGRGSVDQHRRRVGDARRSADTVTTVGRSIGATASGVDGYAAVAADVGTLSTDDLIRIIPIVMLVLALLLALVLRSLIAPLYLVASVGLSYLASLGLAIRN